MSDPTPEQIEAAMTPAGGWTRDQLADWGVRWPPPKGWKMALLTAQLARYREALEEIAGDLAHPGDPAWRCAMEALGRDVDAALRAWHD